MVLSRRKRKHIVAKQTKRYYWWQAKRELQYRVHLVQTWLAEQIQDIKDIVEALKTK